jgi:ADP-ribosylglycohydrolase
MMRTGANNCMKRKHKPIENCYWVIPGQFLAGEYPGDIDEESSRVKINDMIRSGITAFIDLTEVNEGLLPYSGLLETASHQRFPIRDVSIPSSTVITVAILDAIDHQIQQGGMVYLHCWGGIGRTGVIVGCWLARHGFKGEAALARLHELWKQCPKSTYRRSPETNEQEQYIVKWGGNLMTTVQMRYQGCLMGLAVGDALGTTVEFEAPGTFALLTDIVGGGPFDLDKGQWTDDTSMALCLAESLVTCGTFNARDQIVRYTRWWKEGYLSSNGECFDIGNTVSQALRRYASTGDPFAGATDSYSAGNGSLMRLAPVPLFYASDPEVAISMSAESSRTTHGAVTCLDACRYFGGLIVGAVQGDSKEKLLGKRYAPVDGIWDRVPLCAEIDEIACGSFKRKEPPEIVGSGYVVQSLEAALWAFYKSSTFEEGCLLAVNIGNDADTTGAIYGQLAGAYYGVEGIRSDWRECLAYIDLISRLAESLYINRA